MPTIAPPSPAQAPDPGHSGGDPGPNGWIDLLWRLTGDHRRAACVFAFVVVFLIAFTAVTALLAPHLGALGGLVGGLGAGGVGTIALEVVRRRRQEPDEE